MLAGALALLPLGSVALVGSVASLMALLAFAAVDAALLRLRYARPDAKRPFRVPLAVGGLALLPALGGLLALALLTQFEPLAYLVGGGALAGALALSWTFRARAR